MDPAVAEGAPRDDVKRLPATFTAGSIKIHYKSKKQYFLRIQERPLCLVV